MLVAHSRNPNFPADLNILPSIVTDNSAAAHNIEDAFGKAAQELAIMQYGIAGKVWEASYAMINFIHPPPHLQFEPSVFDWAEGSTRSSYTILELGSGSGLVASTIARFLDRTRDHLIATDLPEVTPLLETNIAAVSSGLGSCVTVAPLPWGSGEDALRLAERVDGHLGISGLTHVVCSDLVYFPELLAPLLRTLLHVTSPPFAFASPGDKAGPTICISYKVRSLSKETPFWQAFGLWFEFWPALVKDTSKEDDAADWIIYGSDFEDPTYVFLARRRVESLQWSIPQSNEDLLGGVGAKGSDTRKSDDTFESLLLMALS